jgi:hypothetical protein
MVISAEDAECDHKTTLQGGAGQHAGAEIGQRRVLNELAGRRMVWHFEPRWRRAAGEAYTLYCEAIGVNPFSMVADAILARSPRNFIAWSATVGLVAAACNCLLLHLHNI